MADRQTDIPTILTTLHAAFKRRDMDTIARYFDEDVRFVTPDGEMLGKQARIDDEQRLFDTFDDSEVEVTAAIINGDEAAEFCVLHAVSKVGPAPGRKIAMRYVVHYRFAGELITFQEVCFDRLALHQQLGLAA
ncbi:MAG: nuclear transport factor 2 family protein [Sphingomonas sp.]|jgi:ketosteroid isomerase-like protein|uniref:nuclear transport factor 2 family protein n=1 Tax=Sphingomonas sp. TaxID=28214 RepID=UPI003565E84A